MSVCLSVREDISRTTCAILTKFFVHVACHIYSRISRQVLAHFWRSCCGGRLIRGSCYTARVNSQHDGYLSATLTVCELHIVWTNSKSLGLRGCVGESTSVRFWIPNHAQTCAAAAAAQPAIVTWHHSNTPTMQGHHSAKAITRCQLPRKLCAVKRHTHIVKAYWTSRIHVHRRWFSLPSYTWVTNFLLHFRP